MMGQRYTVPGTCVHEACPLAKHEQTKPLHGETALAERGHTRTVLFKTCHDDTGLLGRVRALLGLNLVAGRP